jgi:peptide/nickel transport system permease protein
MAPAGGDAAIPAERALAPAAPRPGDAAAAGAGAGRVPAAAPAPFGARVAGGRRIAALAARPTTRGVQGALLLLGAITAVAVLAPLLAPYGSGEVVAAGSLHAPSPHNLLGTDEIARDVFSRVLYGIRTSWLSALVVIAGGAAFGGLVDLVLMRITDLFLALPAPVLAIAVIASLGPSLTHTLIALSIVWWPWYARIVRAEVRTQASRSHADAARLAGVGRTRLVTRHLLPAAFAPVVVTMSLDVGNLILALAGLSFIGLGAPAPAPELGAMSARGLDYLFGHPWVPIAPAVAVALLALGANLFGDLLNRRLDQRTSR